MKILKLKPTTALLLIAILVCLFILWYLPYFLTCDGGLHTYNSYILDRWFSIDKDFLRKYLLLNKDIDPNRLANWILSFLLLFFDGILADKIFISLYFILFPLSVRYALRTTEIKRKDFVALLSIPFMFNMCFEQGFYNYLLGIILMFFSIGCFQKFYFSKNIIYIFILSFLFFLTTISHGFAFYILFLFCILYIFVQDNILNEKIYQILKLALISSASILINFIFILKRGIENNPSQLNVRDKLIKFISLSDLNIYSSQEKMPHQIFAIFFILLIFISVIYSIKIHKNIFKNIYFIIGFSLFLFYVFSPESIAGAGGINIRLQFVSYLFLSLFISQNLFLGILDFSKFIIFCFIFLIMSIRLPVLKSISNYIIEVMEIKKYVNDKDIIYTFHYNDYGKYKNEKMNILTIDNSFMHEELYAFIQKNKTILSLNNFQAQNNYFLFEWKPNVILPDYNVGYKTIDNLKNMKQKFPQNEINVIILKNASEIEINNWEKENEIELLSWRKVIQSKQNIITMYRKN